MTIFNDLSGECHPDSVEWVVEQNKKSGLKDLCCSGTPIWDDNDPFGYICFKCCHMVEVEIGYYICNNEQSGCTGRSI
jgi:hypothetical protein